MLDYQRIVEEIQAAIQSQGTLDWDLLRDASAEYAAACDEVNARLDACTRLLKRGLRSEAIQLADQEPPLLDGVTILDFPEAPDWSQLLAINGMVPPPALRIDAAADLNSAYAAEAPLAALLKTHRLLALARAPLAARIQTLRTIRQADPDSPVWSEDLRLLEAARRQEMQREIQNCVSVRDLAGLGKLRQEFMQAGWVQPPRAETVEQVNQQWHALAAQLAREALPAIEQELTAAYSAFDVPAARAARIRWDERAAVANLSPADELARRAAPALAWLAEQDEREARGREFAATIRGLERGLEEESDRSQLERLFHATQRFEEDPPEMLVRRYHERIRQFDTATRRRFVLLAAVLLGGLLLTGGVTGWTLYRGAENARAATSIDQLTKLIDGQQWTQAEAYYANLLASRPALAEHPELQGQVARLKGLQTKEAERRAAFTVQLEIVEQSFPAQPNRLAFLEAQKLAATGAEQAAIARLDAQFVEHERQRQRQRDEKFEAEFTRLVTAVETVETESAGLASDTGGQLGEVLGKVELLKAQGGGVSHALLAQLEPLRARLLALRKERASRQAQMDSLAGLTEAVGSPEEYAAALTGFATRFPALPLGQEFERVSAEESLWHDVQLWSDFLAEREFANLARLKPSEAKRLVERGKELLAVANSCPLAQEYQKHQEFLEAVAARTTDDGKSRLAGLQEVFEDFFITGLFCVDTKSGERYYLTEKDLKLLQAREGDSVAFDYLTSFDLEVLSKRLKRDEIVKQGPAPQHDLVEGATQQLALARDGEWEKGLYSLAKAILTNTEVDPLLRFILLRRVLDTAQQGSSSFREAFASITYRLKSADVDVTANWLLPNDAAATISRAKAKAILENLGDLSQPALAGGALLRNETAHLDDPPRWIGWLRPGGKAWSCECPSPPQAGSLLVIFRPEDFPVTAAKWEQIGTWEATGPRWDSSASRLFAAGRPVYWIPLAAEGGKHDSAAR